MNPNIDTTLFAGRGADVRHFVKETTIAAPCSEVYAAWSDATQFTHTYDSGDPGQSELAANIELEIGGRYEWLWDGKLGSNGCQVLSYIPGRMISFSWNAPPTQPESRARHTWVVVELESLSALETAVRLTHLGFGRAPHWDETHDYFSQAWEHVLRQFKKGLESD